MAPPPHPHGARGRLPLRAVSSAASPATGPAVSPAASRPRLLELYCGIGGVAAAVGDLAEVVGAFDVDRVGLGVYRANLPHPASARTLESVGSDELAALAADLWTLAPPCQPYTRRGRGRDVDDPRAQSLLALLGRIAEVRPPYLFLENVPGFAGSRMHARLCETLDGAGYRVEERLACPSELGVPNRRRRYYLVAAGPDAEPLRTAGLPGVEPECAASGAAPPSPDPPLAAYLDPVPDPALAVDPDLVRRYRHALDVVDAEDPAAVTACFTSAYGRSPVRSGSYLQPVRAEAGAATGSGAVPRRGGASEVPAPLRRFSPAEVLRLLGFPAGFRLPPGLPRANAWRLAGNSLSLPPVRAMLAAFPPLAGLADAGAGGR